MGKVGGGGNAITHTSMRVVRARGKERASTESARARAYASNKIDLLLCSCSFLVAHANTITMSDR